MTELTHVLNQAWLVSRMGMKAFLAPIGWLETW